MSSVGKRRARLGLSPEVVPLTTLADLLEVPVALLLDEAIRGELVLVVPFSIVRFDFTPPPPSPIGKLPLFDLYPGEVPAFYIEVETVEGGADILYRLLREGGRVRLLSGAIRSPVLATDEGWTGGERVGTTEPAEAVEIQLADLLVPWSEINRRGWAQAMMYPSELMAREDRDRANLQAVAAQLDILRSLVTTSQPQQPETPTPTPPAAARPDEEQAQVLGRNERRNVYLALELLIRHFAAKMEAPDVYGSPENPKRTIILNEAVADGDGTPAPGLSSSQVGAIAKTAKEVGQALDKAIESPRKRRS